MTRLLFIAALRLLLLSQAHRFLRRWSLGSPPYICSSFLPQRRRKCRPPSSTTQQRGFSRETLDVSIQLQSRQIALPTNWHIRCSTGLWHRLVEAEDQQ